MTLLITLTALLVDRFIGDPDWLWRRLPHPVVLFGRTIGWVDRRFNRPDTPERQRRLAGAVSILLLLALALIAGWCLQLVFRSAGFPGFLVEVLVVAVLLAQKSLSDHVLRVVAGLRQEGLAGGRAAVSMIVGRDPDRLDKAGVCRAAIESLAENFSDGVVAPVCWYVVLGLPGLLAYKMLNTADSMIGHKTERHLAFGWASARLDDLANLPAARLSALLIAGGAAIRASHERASSAWRIAMRDQGLHRSPNSGWPEAAMAGALDVQLAGPRVYGGQTVEEPMMNATGRADISTRDIEQAVKIFRAACWILAAIVLALLIVLPFA